LDTDRRLDFADAWGLFAGAFEGKTYDATRREMNSDVRVGIVDMIADRGS